MPSPLSHLAPLGAEKIEAILNGSDDRLKIAAVRTIAWVEALHERTELMRQRTEAYKERCRILNERTTSGAPRTAQTALRQTPSDSASDNPNSRNSSAHSASSAVNTPWQDFYRDLPPGSINPWNGEVVPEEHISQIPPEFNDKETISFIMLPGPKTKADLYRGITALLNHNEQIYHEHNALKAEVRVFRSERLGSITTEKREELLAERYESNKRKRENKPTPFFIKDLTPDEIAALIKREPHPPEIIDVGLPLPLGEDVTALSDRRGLGDSAPSPLSASDSPNTNSPPSSAPSALSAVNSDLLPGFVRDAQGNILSPRAAARRANPNRYIFKPKPLNHPTPITRNSS